MSNPALAQIVSGLTREQCLAILSDARIDHTALQAACAAVVTASVPNGTATPPAVSGGFGVKPGAAAKPAATGAKKGRPPGSSNKPTPTGIQPAAAIKACVDNKLGFAISDIANACGLDARDSAVRTALKNALASQMVFSAGDKKFMRYGATLAIAQAASEVAKNPPA